MEQNDGAVMASKSWRVLEERPPYGGDVASSPFVAESVRLNPSLTGTRIRQRVLAGENAATIMHVEETLNVAQEDI